MQASGLRRTEVPAIILSAEVEMGNEYFELNELGVRERSAEILQFLRSKTWTNEEVFSALMRTAAAAANQVYDDTRELDEPTIEKICTAMSSIFLDNGPQALVFVMMFMEGWVSALAKLSRSREIAAERTERKSDE
ncbi:MAG: hypothetical protein R3B95_11770 [Nitrospirales bacterium]|nr:hypothetical protein [Nitrospirales bacterium]